MKETNDLTDLINRFLVNDLDPNERIAFEKVVAADKQLQAFLISLQDAKHIERDINFIHGLDQQKAWTTLVKKRNKSKLQNNRIKVCAISIAAMAIVCLGLHFYFYQKDTLNHKEDKTFRSAGVPGAKANADVAPAKSGAILTLSDGSQILLKENSKDTIKQMGSFVDTGNELLVKDEFLPSSSLHFTSLHVPKACFYKVTLSDGTKVWVNANSELTFPIRFAAHERRVKLDGEAYFEVHHQPNKPFIVEAKDGEVKVLGTHFNVNAYSERVRTTLVDGRVEVKLGNQRLELNPGEFAQMSPSRFFKGVADVNYELAWHNNEFNFKKETIVSIASQLSRWYDLDVKFLGDVTLEKEYTGSIDRNVNLSQVLEMLSYVSNLNFKLDGRTLTISAKV
ncbi:FecR family protein [Sphingobacterium sp. Mn56C]|uniref:FecR family protein n=1 Tax=Sphingobacterium sp. Mn56C TaxID=3395261 RepID=UPI003BE9CBCB